jgi:hypothetical protein
MKRIFTLSLGLSYFLLSGCSKDFLKRYEKRIIGTWEITDVDRIGIGGSTSNLPFREGTITFQENGTLTYINGANGSFSGTWEIKKKQWDDETVQSLQLTAIDFTNQQMVSEYYDDINFTSTDRIKARTLSTTHTYITTFRR